MGHFKQQTLLNSLKVSAINDQKIAQKLIKHHFQAAHLSSFRMKSIFSAEISNTMMKHFLTILVIILIHLHGQSQNYQLVWEDQFDGNKLDATKWNIEQREGIWNTGGNKEFQHYKTENVQVGPDDAGNNCLIITARREAHNGYQFTSGRVNTKGKFAFRRGKLEASIKIPDLANGLWPAFWTLGYTPVGWPDCGEIDVLEMGHKAGIAQNKQNSFIGAHLFWGPHPSDYGLEYVAPYDLSTGFFKHTVVWTEDRISVYFNDASTPYFSMGIDGGNTEEFRDYQHYILLNMAVGGSVPGIFNINQITADMPASMYVDWVRVYQETPDIGETELPLHGNFGIFEEGTNTDMYMTRDFDLLINSQGMEANPTTEPFKGNQALNYNLQANQAFELKLSAALNRNFSNYLNGSLQFQLKTNMQETITFGLADQDGKEAMFTLAGGETNDIPRDGNWHLVYIPLAGVADQADLSRLKDLLIIKGESNSVAQIAIDEVLYSEQVPTRGYFGIYTNNTNIANRFVIDNVNGHLYNWSNTVSFNSSYPAYDGEESLSFRSSGTTSWWGFGFFSSQALDFTAYANGYLNLALRTSSTENFTIAIQGANNTSGEVVFRNNNDPYGFTRDGKWHRVSIPMASLVEQGLDLSACGNIFTMSGGKTSDIGIDDIYLSDGEPALENPMRCYLATLELLPKNSSTKTGYRKQFRVNTNDQFDNKTDAEITYSASGGTISEEGIFKSEEAGTFTVWAHAGKLVDSTTIKVDAATDIALQIDPELEVRYFTATKTLQLKHPDQIERVIIYNLTGMKITEMLVKNTHAEIDFNVYPYSVYLVSVASKHGMHKERIRNY